MFKEFADARWRHCRASARAVPVQFNRPAHGELVMKNLVVRFVREDAGQDLIEYGLLVGIITVGAIASILLIGPKVAGYFSTLDSNLPTAS
jgi:Flp pilus assembly pilin Flp